MRGTFNTTNAINSRRADALKLAQTTLENAIAQIAAEVSCNIRIYASSENVETPEQFVAFMKRRGGFFEFIKDRDWS